MEAEEMAGVYYDGQMSWGQFFAQRKRGVMHLVPPLHFAGMLVQPFFIRLFRNQWGSSFSSWFFL